MTATTEITEQSKSLVLKAYELFAAGRLADVGDLLAEDFIEHNPNNPSGRHAFVDAMLKSPFANATFDIQHVVAEGAQVVVHYVATVPGFERPVVVADIWRVEDGLVAEHWDVVQP